MREMREERPRAWVEHIDFLAGAIILPLLTPLLVVALPFALAWRGVLALTTWRRPAARRVAESARSPPSGHDRAGGAPAARIQCDRRRETSTCPSFRAPAPL